MIHHGDCLEVMAGMEADTFDAIVTDPPYHLVSGCASVNWSAFTDHARTTNTHGRHHHTKKAGFMGKKWDGGSIAFDPLTWAEVLRVTQPGGYLVAFGGARTHHRMACAIEDAGWEIRDCIFWVHGQGFPKGKAQLKPAHEPIIWAQKALNGVAPCALMVEVSANLEALLWSLLSANTVKLLSTSRQQELSAEQDSVRLLAMLLDAMSLHGESVVMDTFSSRGAGSTCLSIALLWNACLIESLQSTSTFTTEMATSLTTGLRTLNSWILAITPENIIQAATNQNGLWFRALDAGTNSSGTLPSFNLILQHTAPDSAMIDHARSILSGLAGIAENSSILHQATLAAIVRSHAQVEPTTQKDASKSIEFAKTAALFLRLTPQELQNIAAEPAWPLPTESRIRPAHEPIVLARKPGKLRALGVDECRVGDSKRVPGGPGSNSRPDGRENWRMGVPDDSTDGRNPNLGRWPANVAHDGSDEVMEAFAAFGSKGAAAPVNCWAGTHESIYNKASGYQGDGSTFYADTGTAARFFKECKTTQEDLRFHYCGKAGRKERVYLNREEVVVEWTSEQGPSKAVLRVDTDTSPPRVIGASAYGDALEWSMSLFGSASADRSRPGCRSTTSTETNSTTGSKTLDSLIPFFTSESIADVSYEATDGGSHALNAEPSNTRATITGIVVKAGLCLGASRAASQTQLRISASVKLVGHPTAKPLALMEWLVKLVCPPGGLVLDPFAGSGTTGLAARNACRRAVLIEREAEYVEMIRKRLDGAALPLLDEAAGEARYLAPDQVDEHRAAGWEVEPALGHHGEAGYHLATRDA